MKKGLRQTANSAVSMVSANGHRPYEEGIKTVCCLPLPFQYPNGHRPYEEGIKTVPIVSASSSSANGHRPYEEGIKTQFPASLGIRQRTDTDLMKKGLRPDSTQASKHRACERTQTL